MKDKTTFFSYSREDSEFTLKLAQDLRQGGAHVWLDQIDIGAGDRWDLSIESALKDANRMLVVLTPDSVSSHNVMDEVSYALEKGMKVIPILLIACDIPFRLKRLQHIDFTQNYDRGINKLLAILGPKENISSKGAVSKNILEKDLPFTNEKQSKAKEEGKLKEQAEAKKLQEERRVKEKQAAIKNAHAPGKSSDKISKEASWKKAKYKIPLIIGSSIAVLAIIFWSINGSDHDNLTREAEPDNSEEIQAWNNTTLNSSLEDYKAYQDNYPSGLFFREAQDSIDKIVDNNAWDTAKSSNTIATYQGYQKNYPNGSYYKQAQQEIDALKRKEQTTQKEPSTTPKCDAPWEWDADLQSCARKVTISPKTFSIPLDRTISSVAGRLDFYTNRERLPGTDNDGRAIYKENIGALQLVIPIMLDKTAVGFLYEVIYTTKEGTICKVSSLPETTGWLKKMLVAYSLLLEADCNKAESFCQAELVQSGRRVHIKTKELTVTIAKNCP